MPVLFNNAGLASSWCGQAAVHYQSERVKKEESYLFAKGYFVLGQVLPNPKKDNSKKFAFLLEKLAFPCHWLFWEMNQWKQKNSCAQECARKPTFRARKPTFRARMRKNAQEKIKSEMVQNRHETARSVIFPILLSDIWHLKLVFWVDHWWNCECTLANPISFLDWGIPASSSMMIILGG